MFWQVRPAKRAIDVCCTDESDNIQTDVGGENGILCGQDVLPGFELPLNNLYAVLRD